jgi:hypothetical protein
MADNILTKDRADANLDIAAKEIASVKFPRNILTDPSGTDITPLTDTALRATPVPVSGTVAVTGTFWQTTQPVSLATWAGLTDAELRASAVPVSLASVPSHAVTNAGTFAVQAAQSGSWTVTANAGSGTMAVSGPLTDTQLRATAVPVSGTVAVTGTFWQATQPVSAASLPLPTGAATQTTLALVATEATLDARTGALTETAPGTDTASSGINGRLQRIAQRITSLIALLPASLGPKAGAASLSVVESTPTAVTIVSLQTNATGTTYNAFGSQACEMLDIVNTAVAAVDLEVRRGGSGNTIIVPSGSSRMFVGLTNASDLQVRRLDVSNTQITFTGEAIKA